MPELDAAEGLPESVIRLRHQLSSAGHETAWDTWAPLSHTARLYQLEEGWRAGWKTVDGKRLREHEPRCF